MATAHENDGTCDVTQVTDDYALLNLADLFGVPESDRGLLLHWTTQRVIGYQDPDEAGPPALDTEGRPVDPRSPAALRDMFAYPRELAGHKRRPSRCGRTTAIRRRRGTGSGSSRCTTRRR